MDGKSHLAAGVIFASVGLMVTNTPLQDSALPLVVGGFSGLAPDLDHSNSTLTKRFSVPTKMLISLAISLISICLAYQLYTADNPRWMYLGIIALGIILFVITLIIKPKTLLLFSGVILLIFGITLPQQSFTLVFFGVFVMIASRLKHRGLTHSLYFLIFWSLICFLAQIETGFNGIWLAGTLGYFSHLLTDHWFSKTKIKWLKPNELNGLVKKFKGNHS